MAEPIPSFNPRPSKPRLALPRGACDTHFHVFGPAKRFPFGEGRAYTPADAPKEALFGLHRHLGIERGVVVQSAAHAFDNSASADLIAAKRKVMAKPPNSSEGKATSGRRPRSGPVASRGHIDQPRDRRPRVGSRIRRVPAIERSVHHGWRTDRRVTKPHVPAMDHHYYEPQRVDCRGDVVGGLSPARILPTGVDYDDAYVPVRDAPSE